MVPAFTNLIFTNALGLTFVPGTDQLVVWEREGHVWRFKNQPDVAAKSLVLDISDHCQGWGDCGLLGLAFHPGFQTNHYVYCYYVAVDVGTVSGGPSTPAPIFGKLYDRVSRFTLDADLNFVPGSESILVDQLTACTWHNGGGMFFNPDDGFLYWTDGDDEVGRTQTISHDLLSGVFRIDVDMRGGNISHVPPRQPENGTTTNYFIPNDNPFVGQAGVLEEFFGLGLRSPHRMTYDPPSKRIFLGDVGDSTWEEINIIEPSDPKGLNFQWPAVEGVTGDLLPPYVGVSKPPVLVYGHDEGLAVIGGLVYRGSRFADELGGKYLFTDNASGSVWSLDETTVPPTKVLLGTFWHSYNPYPGIDNLGISSFGSDADHEIYLCQLGNHGGGIFTLEKVGTPVESKKFPPRLSQTGAFTNLTSLGATGELLPYGVNSPLWSDNAGKQRWVSVPTNAAVTVSDSGDWTFPGGTVFVKHFDMVTDETNPSAPVRRLETRFLVIQDDGAAFGATYKWRLDNSDADLLDARLEETLLITTKSGMRTQVWQYPSPSDCITCHNPVAKGVLGVSPRQLNGKFTYNTGVTDNQLRTWNHLGLVTPAIDEQGIDSMVKLPSITDESVPLEARAKSYLDANCAFCHQPGGVPALWDGRFTTPLATASIVNGQVNHTLGYVEPKIVVPGDIDRSVLFIRATSSNTLIRMPPIARQEVDKTAMTVIERWIQSLANTNDNLVAPWYHDDVGKPYPTGDAKLDNGVVTIVAGGPDFMYKSDAFHYVYQHFSGDGELTARVKDIITVGRPWTKAGIMIRETLSPGSRYMAFFASPVTDPGVLVRYDSFDYASRGQLPAADLPYWMRLNRVGNVFTGYQSVDGTNWDMAFQGTLDMLPDAYIGFAAVSGSGSVQIEATFDNISVSKGVLPLNYPPSIALENPVFVSSSVGMSNTIALTARVSDSEGPVAKVEFFDGIDPLGVMTHSPFSYTWSNPPDGLHWIYASVVDAGGAKASTPSTLIVVGKLTVQLPNAAVPIPGLQFAYSGVPGDQYVIEKSVDLQRWTTFSTLTLDAPSAVVSDPGVDSRATFYRLRSLKDAGNSQ